MSRNTSRRNLVDDGRWRFDAPRDELRPHAEPADADADAGSDAPGRRLVIRGNGDVHALGYWHAPVELADGRWYRAEVQARVTNTEHPELSVFANAGPHFLRQESIQGNRVSLGGEFRFSRGAEQPELELYLRATARGRVEYRDPAVYEIAEPKHRIVRAATVRFDSAVTGLSLEGQRQRIDRILADAARVHPDVVVLPEMSPIVGVPKETYGAYQDAAEEVPAGSTFRLIAARAREAGMNVVAGLIERRGRHVFNTAVVVDRGGAIVGRYDKTHLTFSELRGGVSCGKDYPVFDLDFGRIGIHICYDEWFPEVARLYAHLGAEILFLPVWGGKPITWRTRALDNAVYFVAASVNPPSMVIGSSGEILAETHAEGVVYADLNLDLRETNVYRDPTLAHGMPYTVPHLRYCLDESLFDLLHERMRGSA